MVVEDLLSPQFGVVLVRLVLQFPEIHFVEEQKDSPCRCNTSYGEGTLSFKRSRAARRKDRRVNTVNARCMEEYVHKLVKAA